MTRKCQAMILVKVEPPSDTYIWNLWYNAKHGPERFNVPGYIAWRSFELVEGMPKGFVINGEPLYISLYDLTEAKVVKSDAFKEMMDRNIAETVPGTIDYINLEDRKMVRAVYDLVSKYPDEGEYVAPYVDFLYVEGYDVPLDKTGEFVAWHDTIRIPEVAELPGFVLARLLALADEKEHPLVRMHDFLPAGSAFPDVIAPKYIAVYDFNSDTAFEAGTINEPKAPMGVTRNMTQFYKRFYPYKGFRFEPTLI